MPLLILADEERFKPVTTELSNNYLIVKQEYPANTLAKKRLMTESIIRTSASQQARENYRSRCNPRT